MNVLKFARGRGLLTAALSVFCLASFSLPAITREEWEADPSLAMSQNGRWTSILTKERVLLRFGILAVWQKTVPNTANIFAKVVRGPTV